MKGLLGRLVPAMALSGLLAACGGEGASLMPPVGISATPDNATLPWNGSANIDVLANDGLNGGAAEIASITAPSHGTAVIAAGKIVYTPQAGYFGEDRLSYTARAVAGGATSSAEVRLTVAATLRMQGRVGHAAMAGASVAVSVGPQTVAATADATGAFTAEFTTANPSDMVTLVATGADANRQVKLTSLAGDAATLARQADARGVVLADRVPAINVSPLSSALAALVVQANGGAAPADAATLQALISGHPTLLVVDLAMVIVLVADKTWDLPEGVPDTLALIKQPVSRDVEAIFQGIIDLSAEQDSAGKPTLYSATNVSATSNTVRSGAPALAVSGPEDRAYVTAFGATANNGATFVSYRPDGTASVATGMGATPATWSVAGGVIRIALAKAQYRSWSSQPFGSEVVTEFRDEITGLEVRQFAGSAASGLVVLTETGTTTTLDGPEAGTVKPMVPFGGVVSTIDPKAVPVPLAAAEFTAGSRWAGVVLDTKFDDYSAAADTLEILGTSAAKMVRTNALANWSVSGGWLRVTQGSSDRRYFRLTRNAASGEEHWLVADFDATGMTQANEALVVKAVPQRFDPPNRLERLWLSGVNLLGILLANYSVEFLMDGKGRWSVDQESRAEAPNATWSFDAEGNLNIDWFGTKGNLLSQRTWQLIRRTATQMFVMEHLVLTSGEIWRVNVYTDIGPAQP